MDYDIEKILSSITGMSSCIGYLSLSFGLKKTDLEQEALIKIWKLKNKGFDSSQIQAYIKRSLKNYCIDTYRLSAKHCSHVEINDNQLVYEHDYQIKNIGFYELTNSLSEERQKLFHEFYVNGLSFEELSILFGCAVGTIKSRLHRSREIIKTNLEREPSNEC